MDQGYLGTSAVFLLAVETGEEFSLRVESLEEDWSEGGLADDGLRHGGRVGGGLAASARWRGLAGRSGAGHGKGGPPDALTAPPGWA